MLFDNYNVFSDHLDLPTPNISTWGRCPAFSHKGFRKFLATVSLGESRVLGALESDVSLLIPDESPGVYMIQVHTEFSKCTELLPPEEGPECIISPVVEAVFSPLEEHASENHPRGRCRLKIPHCVDNDKLWKHVKVTQYGLEGDEQVSRDLTRNRDSKDQTEASFSVDEKFVTVETDNFSKFVCSCGQTTCQARVLMFLFGRLDQLDDEDLTTVDVNVILGSYLFSMKDFEEVT